MKKYFFVVVAAALLVSCKKDPVTPPVTRMPLYFSPGQGAFVLSEGNFTYGNSKVTYFNFAGAAVTPDVFRNANDRPLGDVCQSMTVIGDKGYLVINNSGKVEVVSMGNFKSTATITGFNSPRYMLAVSASKAYVTDLYANAISIVNLSSNTISGSIPCSGWTEQLVQSGTNVYVTNHTKGKVYVINSITDQLSDSITVTKGANSLVFDSAGKLWVMCSGESTSSTNGALYRINPADNSIESTMAFGASESPWRLTIHNDVLYYLNGGVYKMGTGDATLPTAAFINIPGTNFYSLGIHPATGKLFVGNAVDYVQSGIVYVYNPSGALETSFSAGVIPGEFCFY